jgi:hypothetical protein
MNKPLVLTTLFLSLSLASISFAVPDKNLDSKNMIAATADSSAVAASSTDSLYQALHLEDAGLTKEALNYAVKGYQKLVEEGVATNTQYLTIVDLSQASRKKRFYLLDMQNNELVLNTFVAHGKNSGIDEAERFSNQPNSEESSLGFYVTKTTYSGKHGTSLRLSGLEDGFNDNAEARGIVVHGAPYVNESRVNSSYMGRSQGCPALPENEYAKVISLIKGGSVLFVYHPSEKYLQSSPILNS